ncbi:UNVERIFIED_CONTAM: 8-hydroxygeraniol oxidoreductase [Sesamum angustifolium]|uniref:8-hydroxygeraniol oxidoreductase n=1 Tax=Sesamum angustifolium TaxID=2727405 RepID=A0AAW2MGX1_9LAMI
MTNSKSASVPLAAHFQLCKDQSPKTDSEKAKMEKIPYSNAIGSVMYLMVSTRPDIAYAVSCLSRFMSNPGTTHWEALKWLFRYLNGSNNSGIKFSKCSEGFVTLGPRSFFFGYDDHLRSATFGFGPRWRLLKSFVALPLWPDCLCGRVHLLALVAAFVASGFLSNRVFILYSLILLYYCSQFVFSDSVTKPLFPRIPGHEGVGVVESVGDEVTHVKVGDTVMPLYLENVENAKNCSSGRTNLSTSFGSTWRQVNVEKGSAVAVIGLGAVGLGAVKGAQMQGASKIIGIDINELKHEKAKAFGITDFINPRLSDKSVSELIKEATEGLGVDYCIE